MVNIIVVNIAFGLSYLEEGAQDMKMIEEWLHDDQSEQGKAPEVLNVCMLVCESDLA